MLSSGHACAARPRHYTGSQPHKTNSPGSNSLLAQVNVVSFTARGAVRLKILVQQFGLPENSDDGCVEKLSRSRVCNLTRRLRIDINDSTSFRVRRCTKKALRGQFSISASDTPVTADAILNALGVISSNMKNSFGGDPPARRLDRQLNFSAKRQLPQPSDRTDDSARQPEALRVPFLVPVMNRSQRVEYTICVFILLSVLFFLWKWWLQPGHNNDTTWFVLASIGLAWVSLLPLYLIFVFFVSRAPANNFPIPSDYRVAMVVTKAPSEPFSIVRETLQAMLKQAYPHDTWLADEDPSVKTIQWCREHGVMISTRKNRPDYHRLSWPRRTRCKEGNLAFFYDNYGYKNYDFVVQLDADHVPGSGYLEEMLRPFADPDVGYVSAPSICDSNAHESWSARGRLYGEVGLHGPLQAGYTGGLAPLCIGSHYAVRTTALKEIGGLGPELAEDHSTTLIMNAHGWRGVHSINAVAHGRGPDTFADLVTQEFQWSRSLMTILLRYTPKYFGALPLKLKMQFAFAQVWYPLFSLIMLLMYCLPLLALVYDQNLVGVAYPEFFVRFFIVWTLLTFIAVRWKKHGFVRPIDTKVFSWESTLFLFARWPWSLWGSVAGIIDCVTGKTSVFRVTRKDRPEGHPLPLKTIVPYAFLSIVSGLPVILLLKVESARGFLFFSILNCLIYTTLLLVIVGRHWKENTGSAAATFSQPASKQMLLVVLITSVIAVPSVAIPLRMPEAVDALLWGHERIVNSGYVWGDAAIAQEVASAFDKRDGTVEVGIYDPQNVFLRASQISIEHVFVQWQLADVRRRVATALRHASSRNRRLLITLEPWTKAINWVDGADRLFVEVMAGAFDDQLNAVCGEIGRGKNQVWIRWGHEMEDAIHRYPWARNDPSGYIRAYRHVVHKCRALAPNALFVWSPKGERGLDAFYPGDEFVDLIGISIFGMEAWEVSYYGKTRSATENVWEKYQRVSKYNKPIVVAELGISGAPSYTREWIAEFSRKIRAFSLVRAVVYFNDREPHVWPEPYGAPDWRVSAPAFFSSSLSSGGITTN